MTHTDAQAIKDLLESELENLRLEHRKGSDAITSRVRRLESELALRLERIEAQTTATNGRVGLLERRQIVDEAIAQERERASTQRISTRSKWDGRVWPIITGIVIFASVALFNIDKL